jgi:hypothetical protein
MSVTIEHEITFVKSGRGKAQCAPNPEYPNGIAVDLTKGQVNVPQYCEVTLPYPAPECGYWQVECGLCRIIVGVTASGRPDDPISVKIPCKIKVEA